MSKMNNLEPTEFHKKTKCFHIEGVRYIDSIWHSVSRSFRLKVYTMATASDCVQWSLHNSRRHRSCHGHHKFL